MSSTRQDAWTHDEDLLLAEVVLRHIRDGGTQLQAFEEVGKQMNRTAAACGFRWNSYVRKQYKSGIELAKKQRKERKGQIAPSEDQVAAESNDTETAPLPTEIKKLQLNDVIEFLQQLTVTQEATEKLTKENDELKNQAHQLQKSLDRLSQSYENQKKEYDSLQQEYSSMIAILERARKMAVLHEK